MSWGTRNPAARFTLQGSILNVEMERNVLFGLLFSRLSGYAPTVVMQTVLISEGSRRIQINDVWRQTCGAHVLHHWHDGIYWWITEVCWNTLINPDAVDDVLKWWKPAFVVSSVHQDLQVWLACCQLQVWGLLWRLSATSKVGLYLKSFTGVGSVFTQVPGHV